MTKKKFLLWVLLVLAPASPNYAQLCTDPPFGIFISKSSGGNGQCISNTECPKAPGDALCTSAKNLAFSNAIAACELKFCTSPETCTLNNFPDPAMDCTYECTNINKEVLFCTASFGGNFDCECELLVLVPTVSEWGLIVMALLMLTVATVTLGWRRRPAAVR